MLPREVLLVPEQETDEHLKTIAMLVERFEQDSYRRETEAEVLAVSDAGVVLDRTVFYARGGGQPEGRRICE